MAAARRGAGQLAEQSARPVRQAPRRSRSREARVDPSSAFGGHAPVQGSAASRSSSLRSDRTAPPPLFKRGLARCASALLEVVHRPPRIHYAKVARREVEPEAGVHVSRGLVVSVAEKRL